MRVDPMLQTLQQTRASGVGVKAWSVCFSESRRLYLGVKDRQAGSAHTPLRMAQGCSARYLLVWNDGKVSRGHLERRELESRPDDALATARSAAYEDEDAAQVLGPARFPAVELVDTTARTVARGETDLIARRLEAVRGRIDEHGFRTWSGSFSAGEGISRLITSAGLDAEAEGTSIGWHVSVDGEIGSGFTARGPEPDDEFEARLDRLVKTALHLQVEAEPMEGGVHSVLLHPRVVEDFVLETVLHNLGGARVYHGDGHFQRRDFGSGRSVLRGDLTIKTNPLEPLKAGSYLFTSEGVPAAACTYIERGSLLRPILDLKYARRLGMAATPPPYDLDTVHLEGPPPLPLPDSLDRMENGALVLAVLGVHTQDRASGDFSLSAPQVLRVRNGVYAGRMRATISGNLFDLLRDDRLHLVRFPGEHSPGLLVPCRLDPK